MLLAGAAALLGLGILGAGRNSVPAGNPDFSSIKACTTPQFNLGRVFALEDPGRVASNRLPLLLNPTEALPLDHCSAGGAKVLSCGFESVDGLRRPLAEATDRHGVAGVDRTACG